MADYWRWLRREWHTALGIAIILIGDWYLYTSRGEEVPLFGPPVWLGVAVILGVSIFRWRHRESPRRESGR